jgi:alkylated DNA nucleotide flippase Atl1
MDGLDVGHLARVVASIPPGRWMSYGDVAQACGGHERHARTLNQHFIRQGIAGAHHVLKADGTISATALGDSTAVRRQLEAEGVEFEHDRASPDARIRPPAPDQQDATVVITPCRR